MDQSDEAAHTTRYDELKAEMEAIQQQMVEAKKNERANALKEVKLKRSNTYLIA